MSWMDLTEAERAAVIAEHMPTADTTRPSCPFCGAAYAAGAVSRFDGTFMGEYVCETSSFATAGHIRSRECRKRARRSKPKRWWRR